MASLAGHPRSYARDAQRQHEARLENLRWRLSVCPRTQLDASLRGLLQHFVRPDEEVHHCRKLLHTRGLRARSKSCDTPGKQSMSMRWKSASSFPAHGRLCRSIVISKKSYAKPSSRRVTFDHDVPVEVPTIVSSKNRSETLKARVSDELRREEDRRCRNLSRLNAQFSLKEHWILNWLGHFACPNIFAGKPSRAMCETADDTSTIIPESPSSTSSGSEMTVC